MAEITDEYMKQMLAKSKDYCIVILTVSPDVSETGIDRKIVWEHGRRNFELRADGLLPIVCRVTDNSNVAGIGIFNADLETVQKLMEEDPGVKAGIFVYEIHTCSSFPGSSLP